MTGAAGGEAEGVYDHVALVGGDGHQLVVHVLLLTLRHVSVGVITILFLRISSYDSLTFQSHRRDISHPPCDIQ